MPTELEAMFALFNQSRQGAGARKAVSRPVTQHLLYPGASDYSDFQWTANFEFVDKPTELEVDVRILAPGVDPAVRGQWTTHIQAFWNNKATLHVRGGKCPTPSYGKPIVFGLDWVSAQTTPPTAYSVSLQAVPQPAKTWQEIRAEYDAIRDHKTHGTPHMGTWGRDDREAISHEFGHMLGLPDEYYTYYLDYVPLPALYHSAPFTLPSIMNNTMPGGLLHERHFFPIVDEYRKWKGIAEGDIGIKMGEAHEQRKAPWA